MDSIRTILSRNLQSFHNKVKHSTDVCACLVAGIICVLPMQQTPAYSRHTLHQKAAGGRMARPLHRHQSLGEKNTPSASTYGPQV